MQLSLDELTVFRGKVWHRRPAPARHDFSVGSFYWTIPIHNLSQAFQNPFLSNETLNIFSLRAKDHFKWTSFDGDWMSTINQELTKNGFPKATRVLLSTHLAILGYCFNPVSFFYCFDDQNEPICCLVEVNNTFGEQKAYFCKPTEEGFEGKFPKVFYVSPFLEFDDYFHFAIKTNEFRDLAIKIDTFKNSEIKLEAAFIGTKSSVSSFTPLTLFFRYPLHTLFVIFSIHYQALRLFLKKVPFFRKEQVDEQIFNYNYSKGLTYENRK